MDFYLKELWNSGTDTDRLLVLAFINQEVLRRLYAQGLIDWPPQICLRSEADMISTGLRLIEWSEAQELSDGVSNFQ